jgi:PAS domain S-box-containing protein
VTNQPTTGQSSARPVHNSEARSRRVSQALPDGLDPLRRQHAAHEQTQHAGEALRQSERRFREMMDALPAAIYTTDAEGRITYFNPACVEFSGRTPELGSDHWCVTWKLFYPDGAPMPHSECPMAIALKQGRTVRGAEAIAQRPDGTRIWFMPYPTPLFDDAGNLVGGINMLVDITERKAAEEALKEVDRRKDEFLATLAHELRGPLAPLRSMLEIMKRADGDGELLRQARDTMERQLAQMVRLVDDLLDVNRISQGRIELKRERVELASVVYQAVEANRPLAECAGHEVTVTLPPEPIYLHGDPVRLAQVFGNLLNNACKYTEPGGRVWLTAERQASDVLVKVKDTGVGILPEKLSSVFEMFSQVESSLEWSQGGLGIGLMLVKRLVEMHEGTVEARSEGLGRGSEFVVRLPVLSESGEAEPQPEPVPERLMTARRILVVDDNRDAARSLAMLLKVTGNDTRSAHDGLEAIEQAEAYRPTVILLDIGLPKVNGYDVCRRIRASAWGKDIVMVALTGWGQEEDRRKSQDAGFDHHLIKPPEFSKLKALLLSLDGRSGSTDT